jgi:octaprenyl-diphosphate synthase
MMSVEEMMLPIKAELLVFEHVFKRNMESKAPMLDKITHYIVKRKGKQIRPMLLLLTAKMLGGVDERTYEAASLVELLHIATLVHDDVVDDANERRSFYAINALWKNKIAVLVGDYFLSKILLLSIEKNNVDILQVVARAVKEMSEGELLQIEKARRLDITEEVYFDIIRQKTASLISCVCEAAALTAGREDLRSKMRLFGEHIGMAFQIKDDIFDYGDSSEIGKPTGIDIREQKMTLPLIHALNNSTPKVKKELMNIVKNGNENRKKVQKAVQIVIEHNGIAYAEKVMNEYKAKAIAILNEFDDCPSKQSLEALIEYTTTRKR